MSTMPEYDQDDAHRLRNLAKNAYESAKAGNLPDPLAEAVKRMEEVPCEELNKAYWNSGQVANSEWGCDRVRTRLIAAAKGEQP